jgi:hypothetical protein
MPALNREKCYVDHLSRYDRAGADRLRADEGGRILRVVSAQPWPRHEWTIGRWTGEGWFSNDGFPFSPTVWALLSVTVAAGPR